MSWITNELKQEVRKVFEPRYKRKLSDEEVVEIAENLSGVIEVIVKQKWKEKYDSSRSKKDNGRKS